MPILRALALPVTDHPDFLDEWNPWPNNMNWPRSAALAGGTARVSFGLGRTGRARTRRRTLAADALTGL